MNTLLVVAVPSRRTRSRAARAAAELVRAPALGRGRALPWAAPGLARPGAAADAAAALAARVAAEWELAGGYDDVLLVAEGAAGLLARRAWLDASRARAPWALRLSRLVLVGEPHRGRAAAPLAAAALEALPAAARPLAADLARGARSVCRLELDWAAHLASLGPRAPQVVALEPDGARRRDATALAAAGARVVALSPARLRAAVLDAEPRRDAAGGPPAPAPDPAPDVVALVLPGGRVPHAEWAAALDELLRDAGAAGGLRVAVQRAPWRTRSLASLALPVGRARELGWVRARLAHARAVHPRAALVAFAHGAGTWQLARAVAELPDAAPDRAALAGCALPAGSRLAAPTRVLELGARRDAALALWAGLARGLGRRDVGAAGLDGLAPDERVTRRELDGGHGRGLEDDALALAARFLVTGQLEVTGELEPPRSAGAAPPVPRRVRALQRLAQVAALPGAVLLAALLAVWLS